MAIIGSPGEICPDRLYTKVELMRRLNWKEQFFRTARQNGLAVLYVSGRCYATGRAVIAFIESEGSPAKKPEPAAS